MHPRFQSRTPARNNDGGSPIDCSILPVLLLRPILAKNKLRKGLQTSSYVRSVSYSALNLNALLSLPDPAFCSNHLARSCFFFLSSQYYRDVLWLSSGGNNDKSVWTKKKFLLRCPLTSPREKLDDTFDVSRDRVLGKIITEK